MASEISVSIHDEAPIGYKWFVSIGYKNPLAGRSPRFVTAQRWFGWRIPDSAKGYEGCVKFSLPESMSAYQVSQILWALAELTLLWELSFTYSTPDGWTVSDPERVRRVADILVAAPYGPGTCIRDSWTDLGYARAVDADLSL